MIPACWIGSVTHVNRDLCCSSYPSRAIPSCFLDVVSFYKCCRPPISFHGNPVCWSGQLTYDTCCFGDESASCFAGLLTKHHCCLPTADVMSQCWGPTSRVRERVQSDAAFATSVQLVNDSWALEMMCCQYFDNPLCWDTTARPVIDAETNTPLSFGLDYVDCCVSRLRGLLTTGGPEWMATAVQADVGNVTVTHDMLDAFEAWWIQYARKNAHSESRQYMLCRFRIVDGVIRHCEFHAKNSNVVKKHYTNVLTTVRDALHMVHQVLPLPDMEFLVGNDEFAHYDFPVPVFFACSSVQSTNVILFPFTTWLTDWNRKYAFKMHAWRDKTPDFEEKVPKLFWRGGDSFSRYPSWSARTKENWATYFKDSSDPGGHEYLTRVRNESNWFLWPRVRLCLLSTLAPSMIDAKITNSEQPHLSKLYRHANIMDTGRIPIEAQLSYKYGIHVDGSATSDRLHWMLRSKSLVFIQETPLKVWVHRGLRPYQHYVPVKEDLSDLIDKIRWAEAHPLEAAAIVDAAEEFASLWMNYDAVLYYFHAALKQYSTVWKAS